MKLKPENEIKLNGILIYALNDNWGQQAVTADNKVLLTAETAAQKKDCKLEPVDFRIEAYVYGEDYRVKVAKLANMFQKEQNMLLEHPDIGRVWVKFSEGGFRFKKTENKLQYRVISISLKVATSAALNIPFVEVKELRDEKLKADELDAEAAFLTELNAILDSIDFSNLIKMQTFEGLVDLCSNAQRLTADNLIASIVNPIMGSFDILKASVGGIGGVLQSYLNFGKKSKSKYRYPTKAAVSEDNSKSNSLPAAVALNDNQKSFKAYIDIAKKLEPEIKSSGIAPSPEVVANLTASADCMKQTALTKAYTCIDETTFNTKAEVEAAIKEIIEVSEKVTLATDNMVIQNHLFNLTNQVLVILSELKVSNTRKIVKNISLPAVVLCFDENCNEADFIRNNHIRHPLFVPAGEVLEVADA